MTILLKVEDRQNQHIHSVPQVKRFNKQFSIPHWCTLSTNNPCKISELSHERWVKYTHSKKYILSFASQYSSNSNWRRPGSSVGSVLACGTSRPGFDTHLGENLFKHKWDLHTNFHYHTHNILVWLKYCWKGVKLQVIHPYKSSLHRILETIVTFYFSGGKIYSLNEGYQTCMIKHTMHVQSLHCSIYLTWLDVCIYMPRTHFHFLKRMRGKGQLRTA